MERIPQEFLEEVSNNDNNELETEYNAIDDLKYLIYRIAVIEYNKDIVTRDKPFRDKYVGKEVNKPIYEKYILEKDSEEYELGLRFIKIFCEEKPNLSSDLCKDVPDIAENNALKRLEKYHIEFPRYCLTDSGINSIIAADVSNVRNEMQLKLAELLSKGKINFFTSQRLTLAINYLCDHTLIRLANNKKKRRVR